MATLVMYSQLLPQAADLGLGVSQLNREVLPTLRPAHAGGVPPRGHPGHQRGQLHKVPLLGQIHDCLVDIRGWDGR